jgi:16S rRNA (cytosine967-C5)-methyltransferase
VFLTVNSETTEQFCISDSPVEKLSSVPHAVQANSLTHEIRDQVESGHCTIQDLGSQLIGWLPKIDPGARVLDACAGLGGKTLHLADRVGPEGDVVALDPQEGKLEKLREAARRAALDGRITTEVARLENFAQTDPRPFDTVVIDAPCTALGTIRRHPEIRWRRSESDLARMTGIQETLLNAGERLVGKGGDLVYAVCSFLVEEGPKQVNSFLERHREWRKAEPVTASVAWESFMDADASLSVNPLEHNTDAFYGVRLVRT